MTQDVTFSSGTDADVAHFMEYSVADYAAQMETKEGHAPHTTEDLAELRESMFPGGRLRAGDGLIVGRVGDERIGWAWVTVSDEGEGLVRDLVVEEPLRRRGFGTALLEQVEAWSRENGATRVGMHIYAGNTAAQRLYASLGYEVGGLYLVKPL